MCYQYEIFFFIFFMKLYTLQNDLGHTENIPRTEVFHEEGQVSSGQCPAVCEQWWLLQQYTQSDSEAVPTQWRGKGQILQESVLGGEFDLCQFSFIRLNRCVIQMGKGWQRGGVRFSILYWYPFDHHESKWAQYTVLFQNRGNSSVLCHIHYCRWLQRIKWNLYPWSYEIQPVAHAILTCTVVGAFKSACDKAMCRTFITSFIALHTEYF